MGKFKEREKVSLNAIVLGIDQKKFDTPISKELLEANDWCSCSHTLDDQDPYNVIMGWCPDPDIHNNIEDLDVSKFFIYQDDDKNYVFMYNGIELNKLISAADLEFAIAATCTKYEYSVDCPLCTMNDLFPDTPWNRYVGIVNTKVIELDNDREAQFAYIKREFDKMRQNKDFEIHNVLSWWKSQMQLVGKPELASIHDYIGLYPSKLDLGHIFSEMKISKSSVISKLNNKLNDAEKEMSRLAVAGVEDKDLESEIEVLKGAINYIEKQKFI